MVILVWVKLLWLHSLNLFCPNIHLNVRISGLLWIREVSYSIIQRLLLYFEGMGRKFYQLEPTVLSRMDLLNVHTEWFLKASNLYSSVLIWTSSSGLTIFFIFTVFEMLYLEQDNWNLIFFNLLERKITSNIFEYLGVEFMFDRMEGNIIASKMMLEKESFLVMFRILIVWFYGMIVKLNGLKLLHIENLMKVLTIYQLSLCILDLINWHKSIKTNNFLKMQLKLIQRIWTSLCILSPRKKLSRYLLLPMIETNNLV